MIRIGDMLPSVVHTVRRQGLSRIDSLPEAERAEMRVAIAASLLSELRQARRETRSGYANSKIGEDDVEFCGRWLAWLRYRQALEQWRLVPEHAAAEAAREAAGGALPLLLSQPILDTLEGRPAEVAKVTLSSAPQDWPLQILSWQVAIETIVEARWQRARPSAPEPEPAVSREPGEDADG